MFLENEQSLGETSWERLLGTFSAGEYRDIVS